MATLHAIGGTFPINMRLDNLVNHAAQAAPVNTSEYSWTTGSGITIHVFSFDDDITFNATDPLGGGAHALQAVNSYVVGGLHSTLLNMAVGANRENYWRAILDQDTTIFASAEFDGAGDYVFVAGGENITGAADVYHGAEPVGDTIQNFYGDGDWIDSGARLTGGDDLINMRADGVISGDANFVVGRLVGGDDEIHANGAAIDNASIGTGGTPITRIAGDAITLSDLEQAVGPTVSGGDDRIFLERYEGGAVSGDILDAFNAALGTSTGGDDLIDGSANVASQRASSLLIVGDVYNLGNHTVRGGDDTLIGSAVDGSFISGDAGVLFGAGSTLYAGADDITGGEGGDFLVGDYFSNQGLGQVLINGTFTGDDTIYGGGGNDQMLGQVGDDVLDGGMGDDLLFGGTQTAGVGDIVAFDTLDVAVSVDLQAGFAFGQGVDALSEFESIRGSQRADSLAGDTGANQIEGLDGDDHIFGRAGTDTLLGGKGNDVISGGSGADIIVGGLGKDTLTGGSAGDIFDYDATNESGPSAGARDLIESFALANDKIDVHDIDAQAGLGGNQDFTFIGGAAFSAEGQIRFFAMGGHTLIELNTTGVSGPDMRIELDSVVALTAGQFIL